MPRQPNRSANTTAPPSHPKRNQITTAKTGVTEIYRLLVRRKKVIQSLIPPSLQITADRIITNVMYTLKSDRELAICQPESVLYCTMGAARLGLDGFGEQLWLKAMASYADGSDEIEFHYAALITGYQGMITVLGRSGFTVTAHTVYANDRFEPDFSDYEETVYKPTVNGRGDKSGAVAFFRRSTDLRIIHVEWVPGEELRLIEADRKASKENRKRTNAWNTNPDEMWRKTPIVRGFKMLPKLTDSLLSAQRIIYRGEEDEALTPADLMVDTVTVK